MGKTAAGGFEDDPVRDAVHHEETARSRAGQLQGNLRYGGGQIGFSCCGRHTGQTIDHTVPQDVRARLCD